MPRFCLYGSPAFDPGIPLEELIAKSSEWQLWAHAEDSGCESCYCEVARYNDATKRWERFAFLKCMDFRFDELPEASDEETAKELARRINGSVWWHDRAPIVHTFPDYAEVAAEQQA